MLTGKHLIAGKWVDSDERFTSQPARGNAHTFATGTPNLVDEACKAAEEAFWSFGYSDRKARADLLLAIANEIDALGEEITAIGSQETGLPEARLVGERGRTTGQLKLFAEHIIGGEYLDRRFDEARPERAPLPRPELRMQQRPIGPVAVFGASNFPLAFSVAGGDTAAALAAGCPVVVKGHSAHPGTSELVARAIKAAIKSTGVHPGTFSLIQGAKRDVGAALVTHPLINAVGFTGSLHGGRALFDLCAARPNPIPFFGELGSINPMFLLPNALKSRGADIATGWSASLTMGAGQFCTNPGVVILLDSPEAQTFIDTAVKALSSVEAQTMLTDGIAQAYRDGRDRISATQDVQEILITSSDERTASPNLYVTSGDNWLSTDNLGEEAFGPLGLIVKATGIKQFATIAKSLQGQLTCAIHMEDADFETVQTLFPILERKAGRLLINGFPTGVEVCDTMVHGGPYPASTNFGATSVGTLSIRRFLRPVCYQNFPHELLPSDLRHRNLSHRSGPL
ncbi:aldehyde dehydrogenase (NADP(+)) [Maritalea porphyrae]|uniref:Aldehyde dehydrogenase n=1 Tax=Maritalea porphyrae TaxID=880732 RepID=A0ABQ5USB6_9HYPH|nr:aldehyde dehydrogenase (NADP(+)) [Maritalea porphyrae]GLQ18168.1 aldehyde dehydrogenase [Maritalea porphyrae]